MRRIAIRFIFLVVLLSPFPAALHLHAQTTNPIRYTWIASSCATWDCAMAAVVVAAGDQGVFAIPTGREDRPWLILRRVEEGSVYVPDDEPYHCQVFPNVEAAALHYNRTDLCRGPILMTMPDGRSVVTSLDQCSPPRRRAVR